MKKNILFLVIALFTLNSCKDVIGLDSNIEKELLLKKLSPSDTLSFLYIRNLDFGSVKLRTVNHDYITIINNSVKDTLTIYNITSKNKSGLFSYTFPKGLPFKIYPKEDINITEKLFVQFIADDFSLSYHYDTLIINNNKAFTVEVKVKVI